MERSQIEQFLKREIEKTLEIIEEYKEMVKPEAPDVAIGRVSRMDAINNRSVVEAALRQAESKLINLNRVFESLDHEDFGMCKRCHKEIPIQRVLIRPESLFCVQCAD